MQANSTLLETMINRLSKEPSYLAWYLQRYADDEGIEFENLKDELNLSIEQLGKLAMCKAPDSRASDFAKRLRTIQEFTGVNHFSLAAIIRRCDALISLENSSSENYLLAARKRDEASEDEENES